MEGAVRSGDSAAAALLNENDPVSSASEEVTA
jgi:hypothetical protein